MKKTFIDLYIVRHGETHWNSEKKLQGQTDIELSDLGRKQAVAAKNHFEGIQFHSFFSSDLNRAFETVEIIKTELSQTHKNTVKLPLLRERNFGDLEGKYYDEVHAHYSEIGTRTLFLSSLDFSKESRIIFLYLLDTPLI